MKCVSFLHISKATGVGYTGFTDVPTDLSEKT